MITLTFTLDPQTPRERALLAQLLPAWLQGGIEPPSIGIPSDVAQDPSALAKSNRQQAAANARAAKARQANADQAAAAQATGNNLGDTIIDDVAGPGPNGQDQDDDLGMTPPDDPSMSPGEARELGLALVREIYAAGKVAEVKALQKEYGIAKFYDVPVEKGHQFYRRVMSVAQAAGLRA
jgi:hypothetical protein